MSKHRQPVHERVHTDRVFVVGSAAGSRVTDGQAQTSIGLGVVENVMKKSFKKASA
jgi:hypothetical protein